MNYTREGLELTLLEGGFPALREIGKSMSVKSTSSGGMITKILEYQNGAVVSNPVNVGLERVNFEMLTERARNMEVDPSDAGAFFPSLVPENQLDNLDEAIVSFCHQWSFNKIEFFGKFQAFRLYKDNQHVDWIDLNQLTRRYQLQIPIDARTAARRLYTSPIQRAYK